MSDSKFPTAKASLPKGDGGARQKAPPPALKPVAKSDSAYKTIAEVAAELGVATHVLRFWESKFVQLKPTKQSGGRRFYKPEDVALLRYIQQLLYRDGYTIRGVQAALKQTKPRDLKALVQQLTPQAVIAELTAIQDLLKDEAR
ncbi:MAG: MerR family transcriptional regulator [Alphaproteobacteria bacterium]|nr:MAG: MerR family transcriptional regulator [Alphaproteobacteria bacterium]